MVCNELRSPEVAVPEGEERRLLGLLSFFKERKNIYRRRSDSPKIEE